MAFTCGFFNSQNGDRKYNAEQMASIFDGLIKDGVYDTVGDIFAVTPGTGMQVLVGSGRAWFDHTWNNNDAQYPLTITAADVSLPRYDAVVLETNHSDTVRTNRLRVLTGTPASTPIKPTMTSTANVKQHPLAYIKVTAGATAITQSMIEVVVGTSECPFVTGIIETAQIDALFQQWNGEFNAWFDNLKAQLSDNVVANLQKQIDEKVAKADVATAADIDAGTSNTKWVTPKGLKDADISSDGTKVGDVLCTARTDLGDDWALCNGDLLDLESHPKIESTSLKNIGIGLAPVDTATIVVNPVSGLDASSLNVVDAIYYNNTVVVLYSGSKSTDGANSYMGYIYISYGPANNPTEHFVKLKEKPFRSSDNTTLRLTPRGIIFDGEHFIVCYHTSVNSSVHVKYMYTSSPSALGLWIDSNVSYGIGSSNDHIKFTNFGTFYNYAFQMIEYGSQFSKHADLIAFRDIVNDTNVIGGSVFNSMNYQGSLYGGRLVSITSHQNNLYFLGYTYGGDNSNGYYQVPELKQLSMPSNGVLTSSILGNATSIWKASGQSTWRHTGVYKYARIINDSIYFYSNINDTTASYGSNQFGISTVLLSGSHNYNFYPIYSTKDGGTSISPATFSIMNDSSITFYSSNQSWTGYLDDIMTNRLKATLVHNTYPDRTLCLNVGDHYVGIGPQTGSSAPYTQAIYTYKLANKTAILPVITSDKTYNYIKVK